MILKDNQGKDRIKFSDIVRLNKEEPIFVKMKVHISTETIVSEENLDIERSDLEDLMRNLKDLCEYKIRKFFFQNIDETIEMVFSITFLFLFSRFIVFYFNNLEYYRSYLHFSIFCEISLENVTIPFKSV